MGNFTSMVEKVSIGCRSRTHSFAELKSCYDDNRRSVIPTSSAVYEDEEMVMAVNECGEKVVVAIPKWWNLKE